MNIPFICAETKQPGIGYQIPALYAQGHTAGVIVDPLLFGYKRIRVRGWNRRVAEDRWRVQVAALLARSRTIDFFGMLRVAVMLEAATFVTMWRGGWGHLMPVVIFNEVYHLLRHLFRSPRSWGPS